MGLGAKEPWAVPPKIVVGARNLATVNVSHDVRHIYNWTYGHGHKSIFPEPGQMELWFVRPGDLPCARTFERVLCGLR